MYQILNKLGIMIKIVFSKLEIIKQLCSKHFVPRKSHLISIEKEIISDQLIYNDIIDTFTDLKSRNVNKFIIHFYIVLGTYYIY